MEPRLMVSPRNLATPNAEFFPTGYKRVKRVKVSCDSKDCGSTTFSTTTSNGSKRNKEKVSPNVIDYSDPFAVSNMLETFTGGNYGSVTKEIEDLISRRAKMVNPFFERHPSLSNILTDGRKKPVKEVPSSTDQQFIRVTDVIDLEDDSVASDLKKTTEPVIIPDSDDEETTPKQMFEEVVLGKPTGLVPVKDVVLRDFSNKRLYKQEMVAPPKASKEAEIEKTDTDSRDVDIEKSKGVYLGVEDDTDDDDTGAGDDGLVELWKDLSVSLECDKDVPESHSSDEHMEEDDDCEHSFVLKDDIGYVCRICGVIQRGIETIIDYQYNKVKRSTRTSAYEPRNAKDRESIETGVKLSEDDLMVTEISAHPRHTKQMKPHQVEGFNFLCSNLVIDNPGGCILAHAPGSGKTFMIISFIQSFLAKYPQAKPLVVLPKGILPTWKREFQTWQVEDIPLYDFYSVKADNRLQQLEVLKKWVEQKSILFLGYKQFSTIICDSAESNTAIACQEILLKAPSILILDEGHTPRNEETDVLQSLAKVQTPRKVVLSGTLYQNHVKEVFNILNLVRPKFLRTDTSKALMKRIMSKVKISGVRKRAGGEAAFYDLVENTLQDDENFERKASVIHDLREMTSKVLHYYKGDFLDELPGLVDFTVVLNLTPKQKMAQKSLTQYRRKFKIASVGSAVYLHPKLNIPENSVMTDGKMDELLNSINIQDGVKAKFFLNMLNLCESAGEKLLVFSQYLNPLKFLERLAVKDKCWRPGREVFQITGESSSEHREWSMERFNNAPEAKVLFGSIRACGEGISLVGASRIIILDVPLNPSVTRQAIGRAFRPGQKKKVYAYRLIAAESPEEEDHETCFQKELIAKMWFEWNQCYGFRDFQVEKIDLNECDDPFLEKPSLREDVKGLYRR